jgi:hypothetical protein
MPRGGKRPGAGAPRGNVNGFKHGHNARNNRIILTLHAWRSLPPRVRKLTDRELYDAGLLPVRGARVTDQQVNAVVAYLSRKWFDCADAVQSNAIKPDPLRTFRNVLIDAHRLEAKLIRDEADAVARKAATQLAPGAPGSTEEKTQDTIKPAHQPPAVR